MDKIDSFMINHLKMFPWIFVSRKDKVGDSMLTTFDLRITKPNCEPVMNIAEMHAMEHLWATFLRNHKEYASKTIYFWPMGCRTGFYLILTGDYESKDVVELIKELFTFMKDFEWDIPGQTARDCWNYLDMNLPMAKYVSNRYYNEVLKDIKDYNLNYPD